MQATTRRVVALDLGFKATGVAVFDPAMTSGEKLVNFYCIRPQKPKGNKHLLVADQDVEMVRQMSRELMGVVTMNGAKRLVVELPSGGAQGARANRCMGIATGMIACFVETQGLAVEWYSQNETRKAGLGNDAVMLDKLKPARKGERKMTKKERDRVKKNIKERVMEQMKATYPRLQEVKTKAELEHIADACATYEAAKAGNLVRMG